MKKTFLTLQKIILIVFLLNIYNSNAQIVCSSAGSALVNYPAQYPAGTSLVGLTSNATIPLSVTHALVTGSNSTLTSSTQANSARVSSYSNLATPSSYEFVFDKPVLNYAGSVVDLDYRTSDGRRDIAKMEAFYQGVLVTPTSQVYGNSVVPEAGMPGFYTATNNTATGMDAAFTYAYQGKLVDKVVVSHGSNTPSSVPYGVYYVHESGCIVNNIVCSSAGSALVNYPAQYPAGTSLVGLTSNATIPLSVTHALVTGSNSTLTSSTPANSARISSYDNLATPSSYEFVFDKPVLNYVGSVVDLDYRTSDGRRDIAKMEAFYQGVLVTPTSQVYGNSVVPEAGMPGFYTATNNTATGMDAAFTYTYQGMLVDKVVVSHGSNTPASVPYGVYYVHESGCIAGGIDAVDDIVTVPSTNSSVAGLMAVSVIDNDLLGGNPVTVFNTEVTPVTNGPLSIDIEGKVLLASNTPNGTYTITYELCEIGAVPANCDTATATVIVDNNGVLDAVDDTFLVNFGTLSESVIDNDTYNGDNVYVLITPITPSVNGPLSIDEFGNIFLVPNTLTGTYTITYEICKAAANPANCDTATATVIVNNNGVLDAVDDSFVSYGSSFSESVLSNDTYEGYIVDTSSVVVTPSSNGPLSIDGNGMISLASGTPSGTYTITYEICKIGAAPANCDTATVTVIVSDCGFEASIVGNALLCYETDSITLSTQVYDSYQWYKRQWSWISPNTNPWVAISGATSQIYTTDGINDYLFEIKVAVTLGGCTEESPVELIDGYNYALPVMMSTFEPGTFEQIGDSEFNVCNGASVQFENIFPDIYAYHTWFKCMPSTIPPDPADLCIISGVNGDTYTATTSGEYGFYACLDYCPTRCEFLGDTSFIELNFGDFSFCSLGTNDPQKEMPVTVYPNPTAQFLNIGKIDGVEKGNFSIFDVNGKLIKQIDNLSINTPINVSELSSGTYLLVLKAEDKRYVSRFIKK